VERCCRNGMVGYLGICCILKRVEDLFQGYRVSGFLIHRLPHNTVRLQRDVASYVRTRRRGRQGANTTNRVLTPFPSFCWISYFLSTCLSISSLI